MIYLVPLSTRTRPQISITIATISLKVDRKWNATLDCKSSRVRIHQVRRQEFCYKKEQIIVRKTQVTKIVPSGPKNLLKSNEKVEIKYLSIQISNMRLVMAIPPLNTVVAEDRITTTIIYKPISSAPPKIPQHWSWWMKLFHPHHTIRTINSTFKRPGHLIHLSDFMALTMVINSNHR